MKRRILMHVLGAAVFVVVMRVVPIAWCGRDADKWMAGEKEAQSSLARGVEQLVLSHELMRSDLKTGSAQFNGEWLFGTYLMAGIGFGQMAIEHPELARAHAILMTRCIEALLAPEVRAFDADMWREDPVDALTGGHPHAAYLGYLNLLLGLHRLVSGNTTYAELNDRVTAFLLRHLQASRIALIESYPGEVYPVDNCFVIGSIGLHQRVTGSDHQPVIQRWVERVRENYMDPKTGLLIQAVGPVDGMAIDAPRGSGTALGVLAVHYADRGLAEEMYRGIKRTLSRRWLGFGAVREYPKGVPGRGDIDSGPIVFGYGLSATGFALAGARMHGDEDFFKRLFATAHLCGAPVERDGRQHYISGGGLGNAILFAMLTAPKPQGGMQGGAL